MSRITVCFGVILFAIPCFLLGQILFPRQGIKAEARHEEVPNVSDVVIISPHGLQLASPPNDPYAFTSVDNLTITSNTTVFDKESNTDDDDDDEAFPDSLVNKSHCPPLPYKSFGYQPRTNLPRWTAICEELWMDLQTASRKRPVVFDYGSNQGFFSISVALTFPQSLVVSLDMHQTKERNIQGGHGGMDKKAGKSHYKMIEIYSVKNNVICDMKFGPETFRTLMQNDITLDYQLTLSVFHWLPISSRAHFEEVLVSHLRNARTTFLELPSPTQKPCANYLSYKRWYDGRKNVSLIILQSCQRQGLNVRLKQITPGYKQEHRVVFRIDLVDAVPTHFRCNRTCTLLGCRTDTPFSTCPL
eukprot:EG_transcript_17833